MNLSFQRNIGNIDRVIRIFLGIVLVYLAFLNPWVLSSWINILIGLFGAVMDHRRSPGILTVYDLLGWSTYKVSSLE
jgi:hypothetical protein